jgi:uncharacterized protein YdeI (YjbR/CyaY-like superfamily)
MGAVGLECVVGTLAAGTAVGRGGDCRVGEQSRRSAQGRPVRPIDRANKDCEALRLNHAPDGRDAAFGVNPLDFRNTAEWRRWLQRNHAKSTGEWVYMYKKGAKTGLSYRDALDEALCFGWIDGQIHAVDAAKFRQRWTPRRPGSVWSQVNKVKVKRLITEGRMTEAGLAAVKTARKMGRWQAAYGDKRTSEVPAELIEALKANQKAWRGFNRLAPSYRRIYVAWIANAKQPETRKRRIAAVVRRAREGRKPGMSSLYE